MRCTHYIYLHTVTYRQILPFSFSTHFIPSLNSFSKSNDWNMKYFPNGSTEWICSPSVCSWNDVINGYILILPAFSKWEWGGGSWEEVVCIWYSKPELLNTNPKHRNGKPALSQYDLMLIFLAHTKRSMPFFNGKLSFIVNVPYEGSHKSLLLTY